MFFNSVEFLIFLPVVYVLYWFVANRNLKIQNGLILAASYFFYGWWDWRFLLLLLASTLIDYCFGLLIARSDKKKFYLWLSVFNNLGVLAVFKYYNFFAKEFALALSAVGWTVQPYILDVVLPVGISFYTFHGMSYVFDIYRGRIHPEKDFINYSVFVSFFPLLVAGPIERANHLLPQITRPRTFDYVQTVNGLRLILWGLFKKIAIADNLAPVVSDIFAGYEHLSGTTLALGTVYFAFQIYCDFSGYSDIAIGTARLFGFELYSNFKFPYFSRDIAEFWRRWHISLSSWFRDYVYIPLGGSRFGIATSVRNVFIIFLLSGFWHGANWTYIIWGGIHATLFIPLLLAGKNRTHSTDIVAQEKSLPSAVEFLQMTFTFAMVCLAWIFFRAESATLAVGFIRRLATGLTTMPLYKTYLFYLVPVILLDWMNRRDERNIFQRIHIVIFSAIMIVATILMKPVNSDTEFIYFQF